MKKQPVIKDERTEKLDGKVAGELVLGMFLFLAISVFVKVYILHLSLLAYLPEGILLTLVGLYALLRRLSLGIDVRDMVREEKWPERFGRHCNGRCPDGQMAKNRPGLSTPRENLQAIVYYY